MSEVRQAPAETPRIRRFFKISLIIGFLVLLNYGGSLVVEQINFQLWPEHEHLMITVLWFAIVVYVLWMALPFVPGIELGLALMVMLGTRGIVLVYLCTLLSLSLSFTIGRLIPLNGFARFLGWLHLYKAQDLVLQLEPLNSEEKLNFLLRTAPSKVIPFLLKHRYLTIAIALNLPGNALIGGGGGIGLITGMSRLYPFPKYILLVSLAITPLPILLLAGKLPI
ncbi:MAG: hypothetical protein WBF55_04435 [Syntrophobacteria bacterium]|jgi:hypothetical protein|nr:hypothetical protein [Deltaproteobacteria bacterium]